MTIENYILTLINRRIRVLSDNEKNNIFDKSKIICNKREYDTSSLLRLILLNKRIHTESLDKYIFEYKIKNINIKTANINHDVELFNFIHVSKKINRLLYPSSGSTIAGKKRSFL